ncbi:MAG: tetratricopeptide repeat protein [Acidobacteriia bacterium]|nr:tetratricopeptide repeat protein [Terriglobia bacterium]
MKIAKVLACCLLVLPLVGTARRSVSKTRAKTLNTAGQRALRAPLEAELRHDADLFRAGGYQEAQLRFESLHQSAARAGLHDLALRATSNVGGCQFALHQYRKALGSFLDARRLAANLDDSGAVFVLDANIASLYAALGEPDAGAAWLKSVLVEPVGSLRPQEHAKLLIQMAAMRAEQGRMEEAVPLFRKALDAAVRAGDLELYAMGCLIAAWGACGWSRETCPRRRRCWTARWNSRNVREEFFPPGTFTITGVAFVSPGSGSGRRFGTFAWRSGWEGRGVGRRPRTMPGASARSSGSSKCIPP